MKNNNIKSKNKNIKKEKINKQFYYFDNNNYKNNNKNLFGNYKKQLLPLFITAVIIYNCMNEIRKKYMCDYAYTKCKGIIQFKLYHFDLKKGSNTFM